MPEGLGRSEWRRLRLVRAQERQAGLLRAQRGMGWQHKPHMQRMEHCDQAGAVGTSELRLLPGEHGATRG